MGLGADEKDISYLSKHWFVSFHLYLKKIVFRWSSPRKLHAGLASCFGGSEPQVWVLLLSEHEPLYEVQVQGVAELHPEPPVRSGFGDNSGSTVGCTETAQ